MVSIQNLALLSLHQVTNRQTKVLFVLRWMRNTFLKYCTQEGGGKVVSNSREWRIPISGG